MRQRRANQADGMSQREAARAVFGLARKTIRKMLAFSIPPGYGRKKPVVKPKLGPWLGIIDQILEDDKTQPKKQRHTAKRIWDRLKAEHAYETFLEQEPRWWLVNDFRRAQRCRFRAQILRLWK